MGNNYSIAGPNSDAIHAIDCDRRRQVEEAGAHANDVRASGRSAARRRYGLRCSSIRYCWRKTVVANGDKGSAFWSLDRATGNVGWSRDALSASHNQANGGVLNNGASMASTLNAVSNDPTGGSCTLHKMDGVTAFSMWMKTYPTVMGALSIANGVLFVAINDDMYVLNAVGR